jgi:hypothetical protein|tara:strand:+ start:285 stop:599 length:315 start_codon:yes stop_codon:yes gene_type:complete
VDFPSFLDPEWFLSEVPEATFFSFQDQFGGKGARGQQTFQQQFQPFFNTFLGSLAEDIRGGDAPQQSFLNFTEQNLESFLGGLPPSIRGATTQRFAPPARFFNI